MSTCERLSSVPRESGEGVLCLAEIVGKVPSNMQCLNRVLEDDLQLSGKKGGWGIPGG